MQAWNTPSKTVGAALTADSPNLHNRTKKSRHLLAVMKWLEAAAHGRAMAKDREEKESTPPARGVRRCTSRRRARKFLVIKTCA
jgi:hypothetical protein